MKWQRWQAVVAGAALLGTGIAVGKCDKGAASGGGAAPAEVLVAAPDDLIGELVVATPNAAWTRLQRGVGGAAGILPTTLPGVIVALSELDAALSSELDGTSPMFGAAAGSLADPAVVLAIKLVDPRHAQSVLRLEAGTPKLATELTPNGYLLVGRRPADLARLGGYVSRTLPARFLTAPPSAAAVIDLPHGALAKVIAPALDGMWKDARAFLLAQDDEMRARKGRAPDFADPKAIVSTLDAVVGRRLGIVSDLEKVHVALDVTDDAATVTATLSPAGTSGPAHSWVDAMKVGDLAPALAMPSTSALVLSTRDSDADREAQAKDLEGAVTSALGQRLKDASKVHEVFDAATKARAETVAFALSADEPPGVFVRAPVRDGAASEAAIRGLFALGKADPFKELLRIKDVSTTTEELPGLGKLDVLTVTRETPPAREGPLRLRPKPAAKNSEGVAWIVNEGTLSMGVGSEPTVTLKLGARPDRKLGDEPALSRFVTATASDAMTALIAQPLRLDPRRANLPVAPLAVAVGRHGRDAFVKLDVAEALIREAARSQMGL